MNAKKWMREKGRYLLSGKDEIYQPNLKDMEDYANFKFDVFSIDIQNLRNTQSDAEFRRMLSVWFNNR